MSEVQQQHAQDVAGIQQRIAARLEAEASGQDPSQLPPGETEDTEGAPSPTGDPVDSDDGALSQDVEEEEFDEDIDEDEESDEDDAPDEDEESDEATWEKRYKDQQEFVKETREELKAANEQVAEMRGQTAQRMGEITRAGFELQDKFDEIDTVGATLLQIAEAKVRQAQSINLAQVPQEQYQQAQNWVQQVNAEYQQVMAALQRAREQRQNARNIQLKREVAIAQTDLSGEFPDFQEKVYPALTEFAAKRGVNPEVFSRITDPALIRIINEARVLSAEPEAPTELVQKPKTKRHRSRSGAQTKATGSKARARKADRKLKQADSVRGRQEAFLEKKRAQLEGERGR